MLDMEMHKVNKIHFVKIFHLGIGYIHWLQAHGKSSTFRGSICFQIAFLELCKKSIDFQHDLSNFYRSHDNMVLEAKDLGILKLCLEGMSSNQLFDPPSTSLYIRRGMVSILS